jgi:hypothetical protein
LNNQILNSLQIRQRFESSEFSQNFFIPLNLNSQAVELLRIGMNTKAIGVTIAFTALTTALNFVRIPVPYMPSFNYQMGDIALVVAFLLFGPKIGITVAVLNMIVTMTIFLGPGGLVGPPYYFIAIVSMLLGVYVSARFIGKKTSFKTQRARHYEKGSACF